VHVQVWGAQLEGADQATRACHNDSASESSGENPYDIRHR